MAIRCSYFHKVLVYLLCRSSLLVVVCAHSRQCEFTRRECLILVKMFNTSNFADTKIYKLLTIIIIILGIYND